MGRQQYSNEQKAAVMAALLAGQSISEVAASYKVPRGTVSGWSRELDRPTIHDDTQKREIGDLLMGYVGELLVTLKAQARFARNEEWLKDQSASEVAVLHGVLADKGIRLLEALATNPPTA